MSHRVQLMWRSNDSAAPTNEEVDLLRDDAIFTDQGELADGALELLVEDGRVMFRDSQGIFGLRIKQIVKIKRV